MTVLVDKVDLKQFSTLIKELKTHFEEMDLSQKYQLANKIIDSSSENSDALTGLLEKWDAAIEESGIDYGDLPPSVLDYLDIKMVSGAIKTPQDIIKMFEAGDLKGVVDSNDEIDQHALKAFEKKFKKTAPTKDSQAPTPDDEDIF